MKYSEAEKQIKALSSEYSVRLDRFSGNFNVDYKGLEVAYVSIKNQYSVGVWFEIYFKTLPFSNKLYMILAELASTPLDERADRKKYFIHVFKGNYGYLNIDISTGKMKTDSVNEMEFVKTKFTDKEIEQLKQRNDIPLDWNKIRFEDTD